MKFLIIIITIMVGLLLCFTNCKSSSNDVGDEAITDSVDTIATTGRVDSVPLIITSSYRAFDGGHIGRSGMELIWYEDTFNAKIIINDTVSDRFIFKYGFIEDPFMKSYFVSHIKDSIDSREDTIVCDSSGIYDLRKKANLALAIIIEDKLIEKSDTTCFFKDMFTEYVKSFTPSSKDLEYDMINFSFGPMKFDCIKNDTVNFIFSFCKNDSDMGSIFIYKRWSNGDSICHQRDMWDFGDDW